MLGLGLGPPEIARGRRGRAGLPYDPVLIVYGDSQAAGQADNAAAFNAAYVPDPKVLVMNAAGQFVQYAPGSVTGLSSGANAPNPGPEIGFIARFRAAYPGVTLRIIKYGWPGSAQGRGAATGTLTGSISGNQLTVTSATGTYPINNTLITGTGIPQGLYVAFRDGSSNRFYVFQTGSSAHPSLSVASTTITKYNHATSWSPIEGGLFEGGSGGTNGFGALVPARLAALSAGGLAPRVISVLRLLGTNDMGIAGSPPYFEAAASALAAREQALWPLAHAKVVLARVTNESAGSATVRAAQAAIAAADPKVFLLDCDGFGKSADGTHFNIAGLTAIGSGAFDIWTGSSAGL